MKNFIYILFIFSIISACAARYQNESHITNIKILGIDWNINLRAYLDEVEPKKISNVYEVNITDSLLFRKVEEKLFGISKLKDAWGIDARITCLIYWNNGDRDKLTFSANRNIKYNDLVKEFDMDLFNLFLPYLPDGQRKLIFK
jgi:hypothetical protein